MLFYLVLLLLLITVEEDHLLLLVSDGGVLRGNRKGKLGRVLSHPLQEFDSLREEIEEMKQRRPAYQGPEGVPPQDPLLVEPVELRKRDGNIVHAHLLPP